MERGWVVINIINNNPYKAAWGGEFTTNHCLGDPFFILADGRFYLDGEGSSLCCIVIGISTSKWWGTHLRIGKDYSSSWNKYLSRYKDMCIWNLCSGWLFSLRQRTNEWMGETYVGVEYFLWGRERTNGWGKLM